MTHSPNSRAAVEAAAAAAADLCLQKRYAPKTVTVTVAVTRLCVSHQQ
jgi:hypothetical protein